MVNDAIEEGDLSIFIHTRDKDATRGLAAANLPDNFQFDNQVSSPD